MNKTILPLLILVAVISVIFAYNIRAVSYEQKIEEAYNKSIFNLEAYDRTQTEQDITLLNESLLNKTCCWEEVKREHNPQQLTFLNRVILTDVCSRIISGSVISEVTELYEKYKEAYLDAFNPVLQYYLLECVNGYPVYKNVLLNASIEGMETGKTKLNVTKNLVSFDLIFPEAIIKPEDEFWEDGIAIPENAGYMSWGDVRLILYDSPTTKQFWCNFNKYECDFYGGDCFPLKEYARNGYYDFSSGKCLSLNLQTDLSQQSDLNDQVRAQESVVPVMPESDRLIKEQALASVEYDFPKIQMNKQDIYAIFNYNAIFQKLFFNYNKIGLSVSNEDYTFLLSEGRILDVKDGLDPDADFTIFTSWDDLKRYLNLLREGDMKRGISEFSKLEIRPLSKKLELLKNLVT